MANSNGENILVVSDLDGTLLNNNAEISWVTSFKLNSLIEDSGMFFSVATARTWASCKRILSPIRLRLPIILMNGVLIFDPKLKKYDVVNRLDGGMKYRVDRLCTKLGVECFMYTLFKGEMNTYYRKLATPAMKDFYEERRNKYYKSFTQIDHFERINSDVIYFTFLDSKEKLQAVYDELSSNPEVNMTFYKDIYTDDLWYLEIFSSSASKKNGVLYLKDYCGFDKVVGIGDNLNDMSMLEACDETVCVANACDELKEYCQLTIGKNTDDAVANYLYDRFGKDNN